MLHLSIRTVAAACVALATVCVPLSQSQTVKDYVEELPNNSNIGRYSTNPLKDPSTDPLPPGVNHGGLIIYVNNDNTVLSDWDFSGHRLQVNGKNCVIENCVFGEANGISGTWAYVDIKTNASGLLIEHCDFLGFAGEGGAGAMIQHDRGNKNTYEVFAAENVTIRYNRFDNNAGDAIKIAGEGAYIEWNAFLDPHNLNYAPPEWDETTSYDIDEYALNASGKLYKSKINNNVNNRVPTNKALSWGPNKSYGIDAGATNGNGTLFLSKVSGNKGNTIPSTATSDAYWQVHDYWKVFDPHCDHITMTAAPDFLTIQYNYLSRPGPDRLVQGMNNAVRLNRNANAIDRVDDVLFHGNYIEENTSLTSRPFTIGDGGQGNFNGPFTLSHGWYGKDKTNNYINEFKRDQVTVFWDTNKDAVTDAIIPLPPYFTSLTTTPPTVADVPQIIKDGHATSIPTGVVTLRNRKFNQYLDSDSNGKVDMNDSASGDDRQWEIIPVGDGVHYWVDNVRTGRNNLYFNDSANDVKYWDNGYNGDWTMWRIELAEEGYYALINKADGRKLDGDAEQNVDLHGKDSSNHDVQWAIELVGGQPGSPDVGVDIPAISFDAESHPNDGQNIRISNGVIGYIKEDNWIRFDNFDFGSGVSSFTVETTSNGAGGRIELRLGSPTGTLIGYVDVPANGSWNNYEEFTTNSITNESNGDLYLVFKRINSSNQDLMNIRSIRFDQQATAPEITVNNAPIRDFQIYDSGRAASMISGDPNAELAKVRVSGTAPQGTVIDVRLEDKGGSVATQINGAAIADASGNWEAIVDLAPRQGWQVRRARAQGATDWTAPTQDHRFAAGERIHFIGQSDINRIVKSDPDEVPMPDLSGVDPNRVQFFVYNTGGKDAVRTNHRVPLSAAESKLTTAMAYMGLQTLHPDLDPTGTRKVEYVMDLVVGTGPAVVNDDDDTRRSFAESQALLRFADSNGEAGGAGLMMLNWFGGTTGTGYVENFSSAVFGQNLDGSANWPSEWEHVLSDLHSDYDRTRYAFVEPRYGNPTMRREIRDQYNTGTFAGLTLFGGFAAVDFRNGRPDGNGGWEDSNHPTMFDPHGAVRYGLYQASNVAMILGHVANPARTLDWVEYHPSGNYIDTGVQGWDVTTDRYRAGEPTPDPTGYPDRLGVVMFNINGTYPAKVEIEAGDPQDADPRYRNSFVRVFPEAGTTFGSLTAFSFPGFKNGTTEGNKDDYNLVSMHRNVPVIEVSGLGLVTHLPLTPAPPQGTLLNPALTDLYDFAAVSAGSIQRNHRFQVSDTPTPHVFTVSSGKAGGLAKVGYPVTGIPANMPLRVEMKLHGDSADTWRIKVWNDSSLNQGHAEGGDFTVSTNPANPSEVFFDFTASGNDMWIGFTSSNVDAGTYTVVAEDCLLSAR